MSPLPVWTVLLLLRWIRNVNFKSIGFLKPLMNTFCKQVNKSINNFKEPSSPDYSPSVLTSPLCWVSRTRCEAGGGNGRRLAGGGRGKWQVVVSWLFSQVSWLFTEICNLIIRKMQKPWHNKTADQVWNRTNYICGTPLRSGGIQLKFTLH